MAKKVRVAVIGSGLAGLTAAYSLAEEAGPECNVQFEVHLFEKAASLGMDSASISVGNLGEEWRIDVPMRSFQGGYYPQLISLYKQLGVAFRQADFSYSFSQLSQSQESKGNQLQTVMIYNGASGRGGLGIPTMLQDLHLRHKGNAAIAKMVGLGLFILSAVQLLICYARLITFAFPPLRSKRLNAMTFADFATETVPTSFLARILRLDSAWIAFSQDVLLTLFSAVCTAPKEDVYLHPVEEFLDYVWLTLGTHHYVVIHGVKDVVQRLTSNVKHIHLASNITGIHVDPQHSHLASIECSTETGAKTHHGFHHIIFATQATRVGPLLSSYASSLPPDSQARHSVTAQINCLRAFTYTRTMVINHTDDSGLLLPEDPRDRRDLNLVCFNGATLADDKLTWSPRRMPTSYTMATHMISPPPNLKLGPPVPVFQTTNPFVDIRAERILSVATLERALLTVDAKNALRGLYKEEGRRWWQCAAEAESSLGHLQGAGRLESDATPGIWMCGSYASAGIPLLEGCVVSARNVYRGICKSEKIIPGKVARF